MKVQTIKTQLVEKIALTERIAGKKESLPVLSCVLLEAGKDVIARATNLEAGIEVHIPAEVTESGVVAVPVSIFSQTIRSIGSDKITLNTEGMNLGIISRGTHTLIKAVPHTEFPSLPEISSHETITLPREQLLNGLQSTLYAASSSMIRPELGSVLVSIGDDKIICAATDSFRLAEKVIVKHLIAAGILQNGTVEEMMEAQMGSVFMPHGLGHLVKYI